MQTRILVGVLSVLVVSVAWAQETPVHIVSDGTAKYSYTEEAGWTDVGFDDSSWSSVIAPSIGNCSLPPEVPEGEPQPIWGDAPQEFQTIYVRKTFTLDAPTTVHVGVGAENDYDLFINGVFIAGNHDGFFAGRDLYTNIALQAGENVLAIVGTGGGVCQWVEFELFTPPPPPANDDIANAIVIDALDFTDTRDTRGATTVPEAFTCEGNFANNNVWYTFTPSENTNLVLRTNDAFRIIFLDVFVGTPEELSLVTCRRGVVDFQAEAGKTYYIMVSSPLGYGGTLVFEAQQGFQVTLSLDPTGSFDARTGDATISGTVTCNLPGSIHTLSIALRQKLGRRIIQGFHTIFDGFLCDGETPWSFTVRSDSGAFGGGNAEVSAFASGCGEVSCASDSMTATVRLRAK